MKSLRRWLPRLLVESILIVVSVLVALAVNDWKAHRENMSRAAEARAAFITEMTRNREMLAADNILGYHQQLQRIYRQAMASNAVDPKSLFDTGLHPPAFGDAAWRSFSNATIFGDLRTDEVLTLSDIYHRQGDVERHCELFLNNLTLPRSDRQTPEYQRDSAFSIAIFLNDLVPAEQALLTRYDQALRELKAGK
jgi:hypothetical protein